MNTNSVGPQQRQPIPIASVSADKIITYASTAFIELFPEAKLTSFPGTPIELLFASPNAINTVFDRLQDNAQWTGELSVPGCNKRDVVKHITIKTIHSEDGNLLSFLLPVTVTQLQASQCPQTQFLISSI